MEPSQIVHPSMLREKASGQLLDQKITTPLTRCYLLWGTVLEMLIFGWSGLFEGCGSWLWWYTFL